MIENGWKVESFNFYGDNRGQGMYLKENDSDFMHIWGLVTCKEGTKCSSNGSNVEI